LIRNITGNIELANVNPIQSFNSFLINDNTVSAKVHIPG